MNGSDWEHYLAPDSYLAKNVMSLTAAGRQTQFPASRVGPRRYPSHIVLVTRSGQGRLQLAKKEYVLSVNSVFFIPARHQHIYGAATSQHWEVNWLSFDAAKPMAQRWQSMLPLMNVTDPRLWEQLDALREAINPTVPPERYTSILFQIMAILRRPFVAQPSESDIVLNRIQQEIATCLDQPLDIKTLATKAGYSASHFSRLFRNRYGNSPMSYLAKLRLARAKQLLVTTNLPINAISQKTGFADPHYFARFFHSQAKMTPTQFRTVHHPYK